MTTRVLPDPVAITKRALRELSVSNDSLTRRIAREGHEVGNHTFTHPNLALTSPAVTRLELDATERILNYKIRKYAIDVRRFKA